MPEWDLADFINGRPTTLEQVRHELESIRASLGALDCVLITSNGDIVLRSLSVATTNSEAARVIEDRLRGGPPIRPVPGDVHELIDLEPDQSLRQILNIDGPAYTTVLSPSRNLIKGRPTIRIFAIGAVDPTNIDPRLLDELELMVNTAPNADLGSDLKLSTSIRGLGERLPNRGDDLVGSAELNELAELAKEALGAEAIAIYQRSSDGQTLHLVADVSSRLVAPAETIGLNSNSNACVLAVNDRRPVMRTVDGTGLALRLDSPRNVSTSWRRARSSPTDHELVELAVPIPSAPLGQLGPAYGVLSVCRVGSEGHAPAQFGKYDLAVTRNFAVRLGFSYLATRLVVAHGELANVTAEAEFVSPTFEGLRGLTQHIGSCNGLPMDVYLAKEGLTRVARSLAKATSAQSVTVRIGLPGDGFRRKKLRHAMVRVAAWPEARLGDPNEVLAVDDDSVHSWVARTGEVCYLPNVDDADFVRHYDGLSKPQQVRPTTRSELCLPILIGSRLVGTMNLESPIADAFGMYIELGRAFASAAAQEIQRVRTRLASQTLSFTSSVHNASHEILTQLDILAAMPGINDDGRDEVLEVISRIEQQARVTSPPLGRESTVPGTALTDVVEAVLGELEMRPRAALGNLASCDARVPSRDVPSLHFALRDVLSGVQSNMLRDVGSRVRFRVSDMTLGGASYTQLVISYQTDEPLAPTMPEHLYRVPMHNDIHESTRPHLGSYTAGAVLRAGGSEVFFRVHGDFAAEVVLQLPTSNPSAARTTP